jgi:hypothetical protein
MARGPAPRLLVVVQLSSEGVRQAVAQDSSFAKKQASPPALLVVVQGRRVRWVEVALRRLAAAKRERASTTSWIFGSCTIESNMLFAKIVSARAACACA